MTRRLIRRRRPVGRTFLRLLVVAALVAAVGASLQAGLTVGRDAEVDGLVDRSLQAERAAFVSGRGVVPVRAPAPLRNAPTLAVLSMTLVGLAARWCRPTRTPTRARPLPARRSQVPRGPPALAVV